VQVMSEGARSIWDEYRLLGEQFRGPATVAWAAEHLISGRRARLTTVHAPPLSSGVTAEAISHAFRRAAEWARDYTHPDSVPMIGIAEQSGLPVAVTMLGDGAFLSERMTEMAPLGETMKRVSQIAHSVAALHAAGHRHGYLIPENLWVREDGRIAFLDAGIHAAAAHAAFSSGFPVASCLYVPAADDAYSEANQGADVYSLVALLLRLITGRVLPVGELTAVVDALPEVLPASLRTELRDTVATPRSSTAPTARALGVHLAFDTAWIRAQERSQREQHLVEGELLGQPGAPPADGRTGEAGDDALARWARAQPTAGVRGGASAAAPPSPLNPIQDALARLAGAGRIAVDAVRRRTAGGRAGGPEAAIPPIASYAVRLGPFADAQTASAVRARVRREWPAAEVVTAEGQSFVQVTTCANRHHAAALVDRLREGGDPAEVRAL
jgi:hypothetical protein